MAYLRELITLLGFEVDVAGFTAGEKAFAELTGLAEGLIKKMANLGQETALYGREIANLETRLGGTADQMERLDALAKASGVSTSQLTTAVSQLERRANSAENGNKKLIKSFADIGISASQLKTLLNDPAAMLSTVGEKISALEPHSKKVQAAFDLMGRSGTTLLPVLKDMSAVYEELKAHQEDYRFLTEDQIALTKRSAVEHSLLGLELSNIQKQLDAGFMPTIIEVIGLTKEWLHSHQDLIDNGIKRLGAALREVKDDLQAIWRYFEANPAALVTLAGVITAALIPALLALAVVVGPAALLMVGLTALFFVISEIYYYMSGMPSVFGEMVAAANKEKPDADGWRSWSSEVVLAIDWVLKKLDRMVTLLREVKMFGGGLKGVVGAAIFEASGGEAGAEGRAAKELGENAKVNLSLQGKGPLSNTSLLQSGARGGEMRPDLVRTIAPNNYLTGDIGASEDVSGAALKFGSFRGTSGETNVARIPGVSGSKPSVTNNYYNQLQPKSDFSVTITSDQISHDTVRSAIDKALRKRDDDLIQLMNELQTNEVK